MELISFATLFCIFVSLAFFYVYKSDGNLIQPHAYYTAYSFVILLMFPVTQFFLTDLHKDMSGVFFFNTMISLSYVSFSIGFFVRKEKGTVILHRFIRKLNIHSMPKVTLDIHILTMTSIAIILFVCLAEKSGLGLPSWLLKPRTGYQNYRRGLGHLYVASIAILNMMYLYILFFKVNSVTKLITATLIFLFMFYFYGCKRVVIFTVFEAIVFYNFFIKRVQFKQVILIFGALCLISALLFSLYSPKETTTPLSTRILSYANYYNNARMFFADFENEFRYVYGQEYINSLWMYVPRALYPDKPHSYGMVKYVVEKYYPGAGKSGNTPAFGGPVEEYLNFGFAGVILISFITGYCSSLFYRYFLKYRNFAGFVLLSNAMGFSIFPIIPGNLYKVLWYVFNIALLLFHKQVIAGVRGKFVNHYLPRLSK